METIILLIVIINTFILFLYILDIIETKEYNIFIILFFTLFWFILLPIYLYIVFKIIVVKIKTYLIN